MDGLTDLRGDPLFTELSGESRSIDQETRRLEKLPTIARSLRLWPL
jgi:hypothetical protein